MFFTLQSKIKQNQVVACGISFVVILVFWFFIFWGTGLLTSGFRYFINDHLIPYMHQSLEQKGIWLTIKDWILIDRGMGRFQPFYYIQEIITARILGINSFLWFSYTCLLTTLSSFFLFWFARLFGMSILVAAVFTGIICLGPQAVMWAQPSYPQIMGMVWLSLALLSSALSARVDRLRPLLETAFITSTFLASLCKESFILFIPSLLAIKVLLDSKGRQISLYRAVIQNKVTILLLLGLLVVELAYIFFSIGTDKMGYAGVDQSTLDFSKILLATNTLIKASYPAIFAVSTVLLVAVVAWKKASFLSVLKELYPIVTVSLLIIVPQILLYAKSGIGGYYLIPAIIGSALLICQILTLLQLNTKFLGYLLSGLSLCIVLSGVSSIWSDYTQLATDSKLINNLFQTTQRCTSNNQPILVVANPRLRYEATLVVKRVLSYVYKRDNLVLATYGTEKTDFFSDRLKEQEAAWSFIDPQQIVRLYENKTIINFPDKSKIAAVIVFDQLDADFMRTSTDWFVPANYKRTKFPIAIAPVRLYCKK